MKVKDVHNMENGLRIVVECDEYGVPIGKAVGIITGVMGQLATNALYFPISFKKCSDMPNSYLDRVFDEILMARFLFKIDYQKAKRWAGGNLNKKWKDHRHKLWHAAEDPLLSKDEIIRKSLNDIPMDRWKLFVNYRMDEKTQRAKGKDVDRGKMWTETHKRKDRSYVTEAARDIGEKIEDIRSQRTESIAKVSPNDALGIVLGPEHPGSIRGLGLGVVPTMAFKQTSRRFNHINVSLSSTTAPAPELQQEVKSMKSQLNALLTLYQRNIGNIPEEFAHLFPTPPQVSDTGSGAHQSPIGPSID